MFEGLLVYIYIYIFEYTWWYMWVLITCNRLTFPHPDHWGQKSSACRCRCWGCREARHGFEHYIVQTLCLFVRVCVSFCFSKGQVNSPRLHLSGETLYIGFCPISFWRSFRWSNKYRRQSHHSMSSGHHHPVPPWYCSVWRLGGDLQGFCWYQKTEENYWSWIEPTYFRRILHDINWICN